MRKALFALLLAFLLGATESSAQTTPTFGENAVGSTDCKNGASAADFDTLAQCTSTSSTTGTMQKAPLFVGAVTSPPYTSTTCDANKSGMIQYTASAMQYCNGSAWTSFGAASSGTNAQSMITGWPDAIVCNVTNPTGHGIRVFFPRYMPSSSTSLYTYYAPDLYLNYNANGTFNSYTYITTSDCNKSIAQLVADGQAFNIANGQAGGTDEMQDGTAGAPGLYFSDDSNTGFYRPAADTVAVATNGVERLRITPTGNIGIGASDPTAGSVLDLSSATGTARSSVILPKDTTANRPMVGVEGMIRYNTTTKRLEGHQGATPVWMDLPLQPEVVSGLPVEGGISGGVMSKTAAHTVTVSLTSCLDSTLTTKLYTTTTKTVTIPTVASTIYHIFLVKLVADGSFEFRAYTTEAGVAADAQVSHYRWIGFVRTNSSSNIAEFTMNGNVIRFTKASENVLTSTLSTSYVQITHSTFMPVSRIAEIRYGGRASTSYTVHASDDGTNASGIVVVPGTGSPTDADSASWGSIYQQPRWPFLDTRYFKSTGGSTSLLVHEVVIKR